MLQRYQDMCRIGSGTLNINKIKDKAAAQAPACVIEIMALLKQHLLQIAIISWVGRC